MTWIEGMRALTNGPVRVSAVRSGVGVYEIPRCDGWMQWLIWLDAAIIVVLVFEIFLESLE